MDDPKTKNTGTRLGCPCFQSLSRCLVAALFAALVTIVLLNLLLIRSEADGGGYESRYRFGVGVAGGGIEHYDVERLRSGWHVDWNVRSNPEQPAGMQYVQMVRLHQMTECWPDRVEGCPYTTPHTYTLTAPPTRGDLVNVAQQNPGSLWLIGNEMDRRDWNGGGQDEMLPELYAVAYHELYNLIKDADPDAQIAIGGIVQPTPLRLEYLDRVLDEYDRLYHSMIPVDVWNIHNMILRERIFEYGAEIPPGMNDTSGKLYTWEDANNLGIFKQQLLDFREWMAGKGERNKPLIVSEYSVLYGKDYFTEEEVKDYLLATMEHMRTATDASLGYPEDDNRLVQRWAWYSLNDDEFQGDPSSHHFFDPDTKEITDLGIEYANYVNGLCHESDVDCDCDVDVADIQRLADKWRCTASEPCYYSWYDPDADQTVTVIDMMRVTADWNWSCQ
jgi:hypothetical protein